jgi:hypothetical protein
MNPCTGRDRVVRECHVLRMKETAAPAFPRLLHAETICVDESHGRVNSTEQDALHPAILQKSLSASGLSVKFNLTSDLRPLTPDEHEQEQEEESSIRLPSRNLRVLRLLTSDL